MGQIKDVHITKILYTTVSERVDATINIGIAYIASLSVKHPACLNMYVCTTSIRHTDVMNNDSMTPRADFHPVLIESTFVHSN